MAMDYFIEKIEIIRRSTGNSTPSSTLEPSPEQFSTFKQYSMGEVEKLITSTPTKSCSLDPLPTSILKEFLPELLPFLTVLCNQSLREGWLPQSQRHAVITPTMKKPGVDGNDVKSYRPISNLTYLSKLIERMVCSQLTAFLDQQGLLPKFQSGFRKNHSTETALLKVLSDIVDAADRKKVTLLGLLDLSAAFDTVDHEILLHRLEKTFGCSGAVLSWLNSFIRNRTQQVNFKDTLSLTASVTSGVPQGSVLGTLLFLLYLAEVPSIAAIHGLNMHCYADDGQLYVSEKAESAASLISKVSACISEIDSWMSSNRLKLNSEKTQFIWFGTKQQLKKVSIDRISLGDGEVEFLQTVNDLGVHLDANLVMKDHVNRISRAAFYQLRQLRVVRKSLSFEACEALVHAFVSSRLDYCNSLLYGIGENQLNSLQSVLRSAARLVMCKRKYDPISDDMRDRLHWLPVRQRIDFKLGVLVYRSLHGTAPPYLSEMLTSISNIPALRSHRSASCGHICVPRTKSIKLGPRSFAISGPVTWNSFPADIRNPDLTFAVLKKN